jgi:hypothetical protein
LVVVLPLPPAGPAAWASPSTTPGSCTVAGFDQAAGKSAADGFSQVDCSKGWGLAAGRIGAAGGVGIFQRGRQGWAEVGVIVPQSLRAIPPPFAGLGISPALLLQLARPFPSSVSQLVGAVALVEELAVRETRLKAQGGYQVSPVATVGRVAWLALAAAGSSASSGPGPTGQQYPDGTLWVYRWSATGWAEQGAVHGWMGPIMGGCCGIAAVSLTGPGDPDFAMTGGGAADTDWLAVVSDAGGRWHLVPFDYGYSFTTVVNGQPYAHGVSTMVDATSSAAGPTTWLYERYQGGAFRPAPPPGKVPPCTLSALEAVADPEGMYLPVMQFTKFACADGWAMAVGTGAGYTGQMVGLFEATMSGSSAPAVAASWSTVELDNGDSLGSDPGIYDIPLSLLGSLAHGLGPSLQPALATAPLIAEPAMTGVIYVNGVINASGVLWYVAEKPTGGQAPGVDATVYRWSGSAWLEQGEVERVPASLDSFQVSAGWFEAVRVQGARDPGFLMENSGSPHPEVLTDLGGTWHAARYTGRSPLLVRTEASIDYNIWA